MYLTEQALPKTTLSLEHFHVKEHSSVINIQEHQHSTFNIQHSRPRNRRCLYDRDNSPYRSRHITFVLFLALSTSADDPFSE